MSLAVRVHMMSMAAARSRPALRGLLRSRAPTTIAAPFVLAGAPQVVQVLI
jgi:hypothetical protein